MTDFPRRRTAAGLRHQRDRGGRARHCGDEPPARSRRSRWPLGSERFAPPPATDDAAVTAAWEADLARVREQTVKERKQSETARDADVTHTKIQGWLRDLGIALGFDVWIAANDRSRSYCDGRPSDRCLAELPSAIAGYRARSRCAPSTSLARRRGAYGRGGVRGRAHDIDLLGIVRMLDLPLGAPSGVVRGLYIVAPDDREEDVRAQLRRPASAEALALGLRYLPTALNEHRKAIARFGHGLKPIEAIAKSMG